MLTGDTKNIIINISIGSHHIYYHYYYYVITTVVTTLIRQKYHLPKNLNLAAFFCVVIS